MRIDIKYTIFAMLVVFEALPTSPLLRMPPVSLSLLYNDPNGTHHAA